MGGLLLGTDSQANFYIAMTVIAFAAAFTFLALKEPIKPPK